jgi:hypothetical protein
MLVADGIFSIVDFNLNKNRFYCNKLELLSSAKWKAPSIATFSSLSGQ